MKRTPFYHTVHFAMDITHAGDLRSKGRDKSFPRAIKRFADKLRKNGIPTIWISYGDEPRLYSRAISRKKPLFDKLGFKGIGVGVREDLLLKLCQDAFGPPPLLELLRRYGTRTIIITGMNTSKCVGKTMSSALWKNFRCLMVTDLLADWDAETHEDRNPEWHRQRLDHLAKINVVWQRGKIHFVERRRNYIRPEIEFATSRGYLPRLRPKPDTPARIMPARYRLQRTCS